MIKRSTLIIFLLIIACLEGFYIIQTGSRKSSDEELCKAFRNRSKILAVPIPENIHFAGEKVPLDIFYVFEGMDRELTVNTYWPSSTIAMFKRANRFLPLIVPVLKKQGIPEDFKYLVIIESNLANVVSPAGAAGFWQLIPETAKRYGLEISDDVDERYHLEKATVAACKLLKHSYQMFGSWVLAAAAYNAGEGKITRELERQKVSNYFDLNLVEETSRYLYRILAVKLIYENPTQYGYHLRNKDLYQPVPTYSVKTDTAITDLIGFAFSQGINYRILKEFNPWLRKDKLSNVSRTTYMLTIPKKGYINEDSLLKELDEPDKIFNDSTSTFNK